MGRSFYFLLMTCLFSARLSAYPTPVDLDGQLHRWPLTIDSPNVYFNVSVSDDSMRSFFFEVSLSAANLWSNVPNSLIKVKPATLDITPQITIYFEPSIAGGDMAAGYAIFDDIDEGQPRHCSVHIAADSSSDTYNLSKTTLHEMGHCLGLAHSLVPESIMSYELEKNSFALAMDDEAAIARLYPADGSNAKLAPGCSIGVHRSAPTQMPVIIAIFLIPLAFLLHRKILRLLINK